MPRKTQSRGRRPTPSAIPTPLPIKPWLGLEDFSAALEAAGVKPADIEAALDANRFASAAATAQGAVQAIMNVGNTFSPGDIGKILATLGSIALHQRKALALIQQCLDGPVDAADPQGSLTAALRRSRNILITTLLEGPRSDSGVADPEAELAATILACDRLGTWADTVGTHRKAVAKREAIRLKREDPRQLPADLAHALITTYESLSGKKASFSRVKPDAPNAGEPMGPLIRYLESLFGRLRQLMAEDRGTAHLAAHPAWSPTPETLASWIAKHRQGTHQPKGK